MLDLTLPIEGCRLWWPEDPFLYEVRLKTAGDSLAARFGMREFRFDPATKRAVINGQQRYLVGTNVTIYRFFEDALRGNKPWDREWVRKLHRQFKTMHWDTLRYCIGFPPDFWYDIATLEFEPLFQKHARMAFNPVGIMLDFWEEKVGPGSGREVKAYVINDRQAAWRGEVSLRIDGQERTLAKMACEVAPLGQAVVTLNFRAPDKAGKYTVAAEFVDGKGTIQSLRDFMVADP